MTQISATKKNENIFSLRRLKKDCYYPPISVDFNPILRPTQTFQPIFPVFNNDGNYFTPAFINPYEQSLVKSSPQTSPNHEKEKFFKKVEAYISKPEEDSPFFNPKDDLYCSLCGISFDDYWKHMSSSYHQRKVKASLGNRFIMDICEPFKEKMSGKRAQKNLKQCLKPKKEKKIQKSRKERKCNTKAKAEKNDDLIIKIPKDLFGGDDRHQRCDKSKSKTLKGQETNKMILFYYYFRQMGSFLSNLCVSIQPISKIFHYCWRQIYIYKEIIRFSGSKTFHQFSGSLKFKDKNMKKWRKISKFLKY